MLNNFKKNCYNESASSLYSFYVFHDTIMCKEEGMIMCVFCMIAKKEIPSSILYEDEKCLAILDLSQVTKGHTLIIPKQHFNDFLEADDETVAHCMKVAKLVGNQLVKKLDAKGLNLLSNVHEVAGQSVMHMHLHLIPRYSEEDACCIHFEESESQDLNALVELLKL